MWIGSYKMRKDVIPPYYVIDSLRARIRKLFDRLKRKIGGEYKVWLEISHQSEAAYIFISNQTITYKVSFRNHLQRREQSYDKGIYLWAYHTWDECEKYFFSYFLDKILEDINKLRLV
ncbi:hypothetical protein [Oceanobacillus sp. Castelsardo]|uniref:hypothetical protein n=1 Tax=Oceanobacillus sp. Castelsardo TaxID=1851204 RepID=UPI0008388469|nr:hypothetical protein [Oceanobacillus sp. Castelsardo]